jgi:hypothetical protein
VIFPQANRVSRRKVRCSGTQPCNRCIGQSLKCEYNAEHRRGRPSSPPPSIPVDPSLDPSNQTASDPASSTRFLLSRNQQGLISADPVHWGESGNAHNPGKSPRSSQEAEETLFEDHYIGPTSGIAFMHRVQRRFKQDLAATISDKANGRSPIKSPVFSFGDGYFPDYSSSDLVLPSREKAKQLIDRYFDFAMPTYRFLHRAIVDGWVEVMCTENQSRAHEMQTLSDARVSIVLLLFATAMLYGTEGTSLSHNSEEIDYEQR